jgi:hypothetical protein
VKHPSKKRTAAQAAAGRKFAAAGRASQATKRAAEKAKGLPTRTKKQTQQSLKWASAGRVAQARKRSHLPPLARQPRALAGGALAAFPVKPRFLGQGTTPGCHPTSEYHAGLASIGEANWEWPCCTATAVATHLYLTRGILATAEEILALHAACTGPGGAVISDVLDQASSGFAGARLAQFWPVAGRDLPGTITGLRLPSGMHASLSLPGGVCVSWGHIVPVPGELEEAWWIEWE